MLTFFPDQNCIFAEFSKVKHNILRNVFSTVWQKVSKSQETQP